MKQRLLATALVIALALPSPTVALAQAPAAGTAVTAQDADIRAFIQDVARATGTTFIIDPRVQGSVSVTRDRAMDEAELLGVLLAVLRANGLLAVPAGSGAYRVVPDDIAAQQPGGGSGGSAFTTQVLPLAMVDARIAAETLKPLVGRGGVVVPTPQGNALLVADYADNVRRIRGLVAQIDSDTASIDTITLRNSSAREVAATVGGLFASGGEARNGQLSILPVEGSNSIVVRGDPRVVQRVVQTILELDRRAERTGNVRVVKLQHASAEQLLPVLQQLVGQATDGGDGTAVAAPAQAGDTATATVITGSQGKRPTIVRYPGSNSLIINADPETQRLLAEVITQLDTRREQVLVEAIVVEISDNAARRLGAQLLIAGKEGSNIPFLATQFPGANPGIMPIAGGVAAQRARNANNGGDDEDSVLDLARNVAVQSLLGLNGALGGIAGGNDNATFGLIIDAVKSDTASNLLSTPSILTLDNEEARILVGQEVPTTTGEVLGDSNSNPFRTIQRQDVGIQLEVRPQINAGGGITLTLRQEVSSIAGPVSEDFSELVLNKRELETRVLVDDGAIVALGGLLDQSDRNTVDKVPLLGDIPIIGNLFRHKSRASDKTNLMIFIRPTIVRSAREAQAMTAPRYDYMVRSQGPVAGEREAALEALVRDYLRTTPPTMPAPAATPGAMPLPPAPTTDAAPLPAGTDTAR
ncbi:type II secretion system secretin GspD [Luteimonas sp. MC1782]|uniref:type II secretion system secretin GspD n=1 Tax=Luteimonas sp. MC1782 TaxID=2760305 RepID=UPI0015FF38EB|nr:type II secretion system secretin GspD [Luteimonas sp. MC1782]MBB1472425.1 type II secretion system secretin GspD [Luteimonas sp. MC1782]